MDPNPFDPSYESLPEVLPIFPLSGALLLPRAKLPLNIFEPRYIAMVEAALAAGRLIGMVQPHEPESFGEAPEIHRIGCAGRISSFSETDDGRMIIILSGVCRFDVASELTVDTPFRQVVPDWAPYRADLEEERDAEVDRERMLLALSAYFKVRELEADWETIESSDDERLVNSLSMACPFDPTEKQALLEAPTVAERSRRMLSLLEAAVVNRLDESAAPQ